MTVGNIIGEALLDHKLMSKAEAREKVLETMEICGLPTYYINRYPHEFSGGQRQRIGIARSLILNPELIVCDEPVSALDVSIQSQIINLLGDLQERNNFSYIFISHDLSVVEYISNRVAVMYLGNIVEMADKNEIFDQSAASIYKSADVSDSGAGSDKKERSYHFERRSSFSVESAVRM